MKLSGAEIEDVQEDTIADELGLAKGDRMITINGSSIRDIIDYRFLIADEHLEIEIKKANGEAWILDIEKEYDEDLGIILSNAHENIRQCANRCLFCFVDQMPDGMRPTLYVKDDDYRHSFLQGNFITLTNLNKQDIDRIIKLHLSPLYISVHTTNGKLREKMLGNKNAGQIYTTLSAFKAAGIEMHTQVVLCPGINDGEELKKTIAELYSLRPCVQSLAVVPVGITRFREGLYPLRTYNSQEAARVIDIIQYYQNNYRMDCEYSFVYAADEFYLISGKDIPPDVDYDDYPQTENGVGLARLYIDSFAAIKGELPAKLPQKKELTLVTGVSGAIVLTNILARLNKIENLHLNMRVIRNQYFGETVTVSGLVTGHDIQQQLSGEQLGDALLIPSVMLKKDTDIFLDNMDVQELSQNIGVPIIIIDVEQGAQELVKKVTGGV